MNSQPNTSYRDQMIRRVMKSLSRVRAYGDFLSVRDERGVAPLHVALPDDCVGDIERIVNDRGGAANVLVAYPDSFSMIAWDSTILDGVETIDVHEHSTIDMLCVWMRQHGGQSANLNIARVAATTRTLEYQF